MKVAPNLTEEHSGMLKNIQKPNRLTDRAISVITKSNQEKQDILEELNIKRRSNSEAQGGMPHKLDEEVEWKLGSKRCL